ncbi:MAG: ABC transporter ATP-binding protein [Cyanobacteria bacterium]|nr:ABC transporter ATP-binding protein [Cyanobacteriota bacterium]
MIELLGVEKAYGERIVLAGADLVVNQGESVALVGGNGSGKTTTLRCIAGLARPDRGRVRVDQIDVLMQTREALDRLSYLPQRPAFPGTLKVREVIGVAAQLRKQPARAVDREIERCGLVLVADRFVSQLSGGERQRLGLAVTFVAAVPVFIFDEPSANLDPSATRMLIDRARELRRDGRAVLYTTHVAADIDALATRVALLGGGRIEVLNDLELGHAPPLAARTAGERALERLEARHDAKTTLDDDCVAAGGAGLRERGPRAAATAAGPR